MGQAARLLRRLALIVHCLRCVCANRDVQDVDGESMDRAYRLTAYFKAHARKVYAVIEADPAQAAARRVVRWIMERQLKRFTKRDAHQALEGAEALRTVQALDAVLQLIEKHGIIRPEHGKEQSGRGRPSCWYEVHPAVLKNPPQYSQKSSNGRHDGNSENFENEFSSAGDGDAWEGN